MKKISLYVMVLLVSFSSFSSPLFAIEKDSIVAPTPTTEVPRDATKLLSRLNEIKAMDKSTLNCSQKKELRKEVRTIKSELKEDKKRGIYVSLGAFLIIILLLVVLL